MSTTSKARSGKKNFVKVDTLNKLMDGYWEKNCTAIVVTDEFLKVMHSGRRLCRGCVAVCLRTGDVAKNSFFFCDGYF